MHALLDIAFDVEEPPFDPGEMLDEDGLVVASIAEVIDPVRTWSMLEGLRLFCHGTVSWHCLAVKKENLDIVPMYVVGIFVAVRWR